MTRSPPPPSGDTTLCRITGVTLHSHVRYPSNAQAWPCNFAGQGIGDQNPVFDSPYRRLGRLYSSCECLEDKPARAAEPCSPHRGGSVSPRPCVRRSARQRPNPTTVQGYLAHKKRHPPIGPSQGPTHGPTVGSLGGAVSYERGTPVGNTVGMTTPFSFHYPMRVVWVTGSRRSRGFSKSRTRDAPTGVPH
jgi:hypothetical protein